MSLFLSLFQYNVSMTLPFPIAEHLFFLFLFFFFILLAYLSGDSKQARHGEHDPGGMLMDAIQ